MATTGILRAADVIFYHPLDSDFTEHTVGEVWAGTGASVPGKVGQGNSAVTSTDIAFGALSELNAGGSDFINDPMNVAGLSDTSVVGGYDNTDGKARAGVVSGTTITWGAEATFRIGAASNAFSERVTDNIRPLDSTHVIVGYSQAAAVSGGYVRIGTVSGLDLTWGPEQQFSTDAMTGDLVTEVMDSTHAVVLYRNASEGGQAKAKVCIISGTDVTFGAESTFSTKNGHTAAINLAMTALSPTRVLAAGSDAGFLKVGTISGSDLTWGAEHANGLTSSKKVTLEALDSVTAVFSVASAANVRVLKISGDDISFGPTKTVGNTARHVDLARISSTKVFIAGRKTPVGGMAKIGTVSGMDITIGPLATWNDGPKVLGSTVSAMTGTKFILGGQDFDTGDASAGTARALIGTLDAAGDISGTSASYPSVIGHDRIVMAMWARNLTSGGSTVTVERGYSVAMTATSIELGGTTATWSGTGIADLMSAMNDDSDHLLVLDFENTGGTDWTLKTSVDGGGFADQGTQTSGTQVVATADTDPSLDIVDGFGSTQWIDELVMWAGDKSSFESFETQELANLNDLADTFGETMNQFEENFGAPICWQATATMPDGTVWRDSGSGPCPPVVRVPRGAEDVVVTDDGSRASPRIIEG